MFNLADIVSLFSEFSFGTPLLNLHIHITSEDDADRQMEVKCVSLSA